MNVGVLSRFREVKAPNGKYSCSVLTMRSWLSEFRTQSHALHLYPPAGAPVSGFLTRIILDGKSAGEVNSVELIAGDRFASPILFVILATTFLCFDPEDAQGYKSGDLLRIQL